MAACSIVRLSLALILISGFHSYSSAQLADSTETTGSLITQGPVWTRTPQEIYSHYSQIAAPYDVSDLRPLGLGVALVTRDMMSLAPAEVLLVLSHSEYGPGSPDFMNEEYSWGCPLPFGSHSVPPGEVRAFKEYDRAFREQHKTPIQRQIHAEEYRAKYIAVITDVIQPVREYYRNAVFEETVPIVLETQDYDFERQRFQFNSWRIVQSLVGKVLRLDEAWGIHAPSLFKNIPLWLPADPLLADAIVQGKQAELSFVFSSRANDQVSINQSLVHTIPLIIGVRFASHTRDPFEYVWIAKRVKVVMSGGIPGTPFYQQCQRALSDLEREYNALVSVETIKTARAQTVEVIVESTLNNDDTAELVAAFGQDTFTEARLREQVEAALMRAFPNPSPSPIAKPDTSEPKRVESARPSAPSERAAGILADVVAKAGGALVSELSSVEREVRGTVTTSYGKMKLTQKSVLTADGCVWQRTELGSKKVTSGGCQGKGWIDYEKGLCAEMSESNLVEWQDAIQRDYFSLLLSAGDLKVLEDPGEVAINGQQYDVVRVSCPSGRILTLFVHRRSSNIHRMEFVERGFDGQDAEARMELMDYRDVNGINVPHWIKVFHGGELVVESNLRSIRFNRDIDGRVFERVR